MKSQRKTDVLESASDQRDGSGWRSAWQKACAGIAFWLAWGVAYRFFNLWNEASERAIYLERPVDVMPWIIQSWTVSIYLLIGLPLPLVPFLLGLRFGRYYRMLASFAVASAIAFTTYAIYPLCMKRPEFTSDSWGDGWMRMVTSVDHDANCLPSLHTTLAVLAALWIVDYVPRRVPRWIAWACAVAVCVSTITTGQHYLIDVAGGVVTAVLAYALTRWSFVATPQRTLPTEA